MAGAAGDHRRRHRVARPLLADVQGQILLMPSRWRSQPMSPGASPPAERSSFMPKQLHVSNLSPTVDDSDLTRLFAAHGTVRRAEVFPSSPAAAASATGRVDMASEAEGDAAIEGLDGQAYCGRLLAVGWATPRQVAGGGDAPLFDSMNMAEESVPLVSHGAAPVDFGD